MKLNQLALFVTIAEEGQIGRAAMRIGISQPALTKQLKSLEQSVGSPLFERNRSGVQLTQAGTLLLTRARGILSNADEAQRELTELATGATGLLRVGAGPSMAEYLLPQVVGGLLSRFPRIELRVMSALNDVLFESLRTGELDLVISAIPETTPEDFDQELLLHDELVVVANNGHPLLRRDRVRLRDLADASWVLPPPRVLARQWLNQQFGKHRLPPPRAAVEADSETSVLAIVSNTLLLGFQPRSHILAPGSRTRIAELRAPELCWRRPIGISWRKGAYLPKASRHFTASLREIAARNSGLGSRLPAARKQNTVRARPA